MNVVPATPVLPRGLVGYDPRLDEDILRFNRVGYPDRRADLVEPRWRWMFLASAQRLRVTPMVWMYRTASAIVAHQGAIPVRLRVGNHELTTGWFVETMVLESHRGKAVGPMIVKRALEDLPINLSLGQTAEMRALQFALGWVPVAPLEEFVYALEPYAVVTGKVPWLVSPVAAAALSVRQRARGWRRARGLPAGVTVRELVRFGTEHDRLWECIRDRFQCAVVRDASYLNWKYVDQPGQTFTRLEISRQNRPVAVIVVTVRGPEIGYAYRRGFIVDVVVDPYDGEAVAGALHAACTTLRQLGAALVRFDLISDALVPRVKAYGFMSRSAGRVLLVATGNADADEARWMKNPDGWLVTAGDSDIDRPW